MNQLPSVDYLHQCFTYNPESGVLTWKVRPRDHFASEWSWTVFNKTWAGNETGTPSKHGYLKVCLNGKTLLAHHIVWCLCTGDWSTTELDHIDGVPQNNRIENLRQATDSQQAINRGKPKNNTSGFKGVYWHQPANRWYAQITKEGKTKHLGFFDNPEQAHLVRLVAAEQIHGEYARSELLEMGKEYQP